MNFVYLRKNPLLHLLTFFFFAKFQKNIYKNITICVWELYITENFINIQEEVLRFVIF
jgi:hypothetical protein